MRNFVAVCWLAAGLCACAPASDRPLASRDVVLGRAPASETLLRLKQPCTVATDRGLTYVLPAGDYKPVSADSKGIYYKPGRMVEVRNGAQSVWIPGAGIHFPAHARSGAKPSLWVKAVDLEWGRATPVKWALPGECWQPDGATISIVHGAVELPAR